MSIADELQKLQQQRNEKMRAQRPLPNHATPDSADRAMMMKMSQLSKEIQEAQKNGKGEATEIKVKKDELKKLQDERTKKMSNKPKETSYEGTENREKQLKAPEKDLQDNPTNN